jgi:protease-4
VRMEHVMLGDLLRWAKIGHETLKSGRFKDLGSLDRPITPEEREILQSLLATLHAQFKEDVARRRNLPIEKVDELADGRVFAAGDAVELGLVDEIGGYERAIGLAGELGGIEGRPEIVFPQKRAKWIRRIMEEARSAIEGMAQGSAGYWRPVTALSDNSTAM